MSTVDGLVGALDLDRDGGLAALDHGYLFVVALDRLAGLGVSHDFMDDERKGRDKDGLKAVGGGRTLYLN